MGEKQYCITSCYEICIVEPQLRGNRLKNSCTNGLFYLSEVSSALKLLRFPVIVQFLLSVKCFHRSGTGLGRFSWRQVKISWILFFVNE